MEKMDNRIIKVETFESYGSAAFPISTQINKWLDENKDKTIIDIKFQMAVDNECYTSTWGMVVYTF